MYRCTEKEEFLNNKHLELAEMEEEIILESEMRGAMNSIELAIDRLYQNINERACQMAMIDIMFSQALPVWNCQFGQERIFQHQHIFNRLASEFHQHVRLGSVMVSIHLYLILERIEYQSGLG